LVIGVFALDIFCTVALLILNWKNPDARDQTRYPVNLTMSLITYAWSLALPIVVMVLALRARKSLGHAAPVR
jgi:hypothetical protein